MNTNRQQGFTLIELMILIAIIGILGGVAIPAYQDYTARAQVSEGFSLANGAKSYIADFWSNTGVFPQSNAMANLPLPVSIGGKYVSQVSVGTQGIITVIMKGSGSVVGPIVSKTFKIAPTTTGGSLSWICTSGGSIALKYLPKSCSS